MSTDLREAQHRAINHVLRRMIADGRLAYLIGPGSQAYDLLTEAYARAIGEDVDEWRAAFEPTLKPEPWPCGVPEVDERKPE